MWLTLPVSIFNKLFNCWLDQKQVLVHKTDT